MVLDHVNPSGYKGFYLVCDKDSFVSRINPSFFYKSLNIKDTGLSYFFQMDLLHLKFTLNSPVYLWVNYFSSQSSS